uniref:PARP-type domain-containing protein n=1 Tax=Panagrolaimus davidi TaxID=227884 RepID=A0A914PVV6_9BILA
MGVLFQYASPRKLCHNVCNECGEKIRVGALVSFYQQQKWHHYDCFWTQRAVDEYRKSDIMILLKRRPINNGRRTVSLKEYDKDPDGYQLEITLAELAKIREQFALAKEHKTQYFIPSVLRTNDVNCAAEKCYFRSGRGSAETTSDEKYLCAAPECLQCHLKNGYIIIGLRIRYQTKTYHPECLAAIGKVNIDGVEIGNYHKLGSYQKERLRKCFKKSKDFDIPSIKKAKRGDYCTLADCPAANGQPSKFPWPYTIKQDELQVKFHGDIYHPSCFKSAKKSEIDIKNFLGYDSLSQGTKQLLEKIFEDIEMDIEEGESSGNSDCGGSSGFKSDQMDNDIEGPPAKNAGVGAQTVNHREEREGNQESENLVENVVSGNDMDDVIEIPEIKKEVKAEQEYITIDDDDETDVVKVEPQNDIRQNGKEVQPIIIQEPFVNTIFQLFQLPSEDFIRSTLANLKITFTRDGYGFLCKIKYTDIPATASPGTTFEISSSEYSFFKCLSLFFTGEENHYYCTIDGIDFSKVDESSEEFKKLHECNKLTNAHFNLICSWLKCRIGIFSNGRLSGKYGNWNGNEPIFLIQNENGFFKPVLSLN